MGILVERCYILHEKNPQVLNLSTLEIISKQFYGYTNLGMDSTEVWNRGKEDLMALYGSSDEDKGEPGYCIVLETVTVGGSVRGFSGSVCLEQLVPCVCHDNVMRDRIAAPNIPYPH
ncbi:hypothetical protein RB195_005013 [Necator americanus]|uniref:Uncharacterized protein n=1 Tax=Necator americanus TaxID=51031 RepID=A0ABR1BMD4_NECAM